MATKIKKKVLSTGLVSTLEDPRFCQDAAAKKWREIVCRFQERSELHKSYINDITTKLKTHHAMLESSELEKADFCVAVAAATLSRNIMGGIVADVVIPEHPFIAYNSEQREVLERRKTTKWPGRKEMDQFISGEIPKMPAAVFRFAAGGCITILRTKDRNGGYQEHIVVSQKDEGAVIHPNHLIPSSGVAEKVDDWSNPIRIIVNECVEEIRITTNKDDTQDWFCPKFPDIHHNVYNEVVEETISLTRECIRNYEENKNYATEINGRKKESPGALLPVPAELITDLGCDQLRIWHGQKKTYEGNFENDLLNELYFALDSEYGAVDVMAAVRITIENYPLSELRVLDGECIWDKKYGIRKPLWRRVYLFTPEEFAKIFMGEQAVATTFFGRNEKGQWIEGAPCVLNAYPQINPPLWAIGLAVLKRLYDIDVAPFDVQQMCKPEITFVNDAIEAGDVERIALMLSRVPTLPFHTNDEGLTPLHVAAFVGNLQIAEQLCNGGACLDALDNNGRTPLFFAAEREHTDIVRLLLVRGANPNIMTIEQYKYQRSPLHNAASNGNLEVISLLLNYGANSLLTDECGNIPRKLAEFGKHGEAVELIEKWMAQ